VQPLATVPIERFPRKQPIQRSSFGAPRFRVVRPLRHRRRTNHGRRGPGLSRRFTAHRCRNAAPRPSTRRRFRPVTPAPDARGTLDSPVRAPPLPDTLPVKNHRPPRFFRPKNIHESSRFLRNVASCVTPLSLSRYPVQRGTQRGGVAS
jgi:hypothetical protein